MKIILVTNIVPPYRQRAYGVLARLARARDRDGELHVVCTQHHEPQRGWPILTGDFTQSILPGVKMPLGENRVIALNFGLLHTLDAARPDVLVLAGFGPAQWQAHRYAYRYNIPTIVQFDGWAGSDVAYQNPLRQSIRHRMIARARIGIAAGENGHDWFVRFGKAGTDILIAPIPPSFTPPDHRSGFDDRPIDLLWCGRPTRSKGFDTFLEIASQLHRNGTAKNIRIVGADHHNGVADRLSHMGLSAATELMENVAPSKLPALYQQAKLCLLPSRNDAYGVTVIEAITCGTVALATNQVGCARDVLGSSEILPCNILSVWVDACTRLLCDQVAWQETQTAQHARIPHNNPAHHAKTLWQACLMATNQTEAA
ncbi:glycosyltransferase family 4 protein [Thalassospira xianhensis]|uniref:Glycosyl transferase family 1 domain-containing protein n=1 Tax=Thalassospira xianhensis MCCC 1A02616 TaxID=1177929 RepID=A0A367UAC1_9PROT|nr:glycosyltransferase [Thalassospira xianhensis]RCK05257.1 hypothetical protein TH5_15440 [Thalassospira xianhensis MCCC 1A02616]